MAAVSPTLAQRARELKIHGEMIPVRAQVATIDGLSAHADRREIVRWLRGFRRPPRKTFVVHAEPRAAESLTRFLRAELGWEVNIARDGESVSLA